MHKKQKSEYVVKSLTEKISQAFAISKIPPISNLIHFVEKEQKK